jgi:hypothetical protein
VDFDRLGEEIVRDASGETVTTVPGTFFVDFLGTPPTLGGPPESEVRTITHIGRGLTLTDEERVVSSENNGVPSASVSLEITGLPGADWTIGSQFCRPARDDVPSSSRNLHLFIH